MFELTLEWVGMGEKKRLDLKGAATLKSAALMTVKVDLTLLPTEPRRLMSQEGIESVADTRSVPDWRKPW